MAEFPALPLWTDAYLADTRHLSTLEHGAYLLLLMEAWRRPHCDLPDDDRILARLAGLSTAEWDTVKPIVMDLWSLDGRSKTWKQKRLTDERSYVKKRSRSQSDKAAKRWNKPKNDDAAALPEQCPDDAPTPTPTVEEETIVSPSSPRTSSRVDPFPRPDWAPPEVWSDFLKNRSKKRLPNTATAHAQFLRDIAKFVSPEWPLTRLFTAITAKGWAGAYDPRPSHDQRSQGQSNGHASPRPSNDGAVAELERRALARRAQPSPDEAGRQATGAGGGTGLIAIAGPGAGERR